MAFGLRQANKLRGNLKLLAAFSSAPPQFFSRCRDVRLPAALGFEIAASQSTTRQAICAAAIPTCNAASRIATRQTLLGELSGKHFAAGILQASQRKDLDTVTSRTSPGLRGWPTARLSQNSVTNGLYHLLGCRLCRYVQNDSFFSTSMETHSGFLNQWFQDTTDVGLIYRIP